jgi:hypothetical protein
VLRFALILFPDPGLLTLTRYSARSASIGSRRAARLAGPTPDTTPVARLTRDRRHHERERRLDGEPVDGRAQSPGQPQAGGDAG